MNKAHDVGNISFSGKIIRLTVDGKEYALDLTAHSVRLARATQEQREKVEVSPSGYGLHWPDLDEDLSIDGLIGIRHVTPVKSASA
jgi:hypothetical protein